MAIINAASPGLADIQAAITLADPGDTVMVPAGSATWDSNLVITKGILLLTETPGGVTITSNYAQVGNLYSDGFYLVTYKPTNPVLNNPFRLSGFVWDLGTKCKWLKLENNTSIIINKIRLDHNVVSNTYNGDTQAAFFVYGTVFGVADNNTFASAYFRWMGAGDDTWTDISFSHGTANNFYFEDNDITVCPYYRCVAYSEGGGIYAFRHNVIAGVGSSYPIFDAHGNYPHWGTMGIEICENTINYGAYDARIFDHRGGMGLIYNNTLNTTGSALCGNAREEYKDSLNPPAYSPITGQPQHVSDSYYWNNKRNGVTLLDPAITGTIDYDAISEPPYRVVPQWNLDCWRQVTPFDGSSGVGVGLLSARPTRLEMLDLSPAAPVGVGWWATDEKRLYRWTGNIWYIYYTPYAYPHPLRGEGTAYLLSDYYENGILDHVFKVSSLAQPSHIYVALTKSTIEDADTGQTLPSEISGGNYARKLCDTWDVASSGQTANTGAITFNQATANWGAITDMALCDAVTGGNVLVYGKMNSPRTVNSGDTLAFLAGTVIAKLE